MARALGIVLSLALGAGLAAGAGAAAEPSRAGVVIAVQGQTTVTRASLPDPLPLRFRDDLFVHDRIDTFENAIARVLLGGKAVVTIRERSVFTITEEPDRAIVDVQAGTVAVGVAKSRLGPGETVEIRTPRAIAAIRGSLVVVFVRQHDDLFVTFQVSPPVAMWRHTDPGTIVPLAAYHAVVVAPGPGGGIATPRALTADEVARFMRVVEVPKRGAGPPDRVIDRLLEEAGRLADQYHAAASDGAPGAPLGDLLPDSWLLENALTRRPGLGAPGGPPEAGPPGRGGVPRGRDLGGPAVSRPSAAFPPPGGGGGPGGGGDPGGGGGAPPPPPPAPPSGAFVPPGQGGGKPNSPGNPTPGQGGVPPGQLKKN